VYVSAPRLHRLHKLGRLHGRNRVFLRSCARNGAGEVLGSGVSKKKCVGKGEHTCAPYRLSFLVLLGFHALRWADGPVVRLPAFNSSFQVGGEVRIREKKCAARTCDGERAAFACVVRANVGTCLTRVGAFGSCFHAWGVGI